MKQNLPYDTISAQTNKILSKLQLLMQTTARKKPNNLQKKIFQDRDERSNIPWNQTTINM